jgi:site-specific recombinase XerD
LPPISRRRFFLRIPLVYFEMTGDERAAAAVEMWSETMVQMGNRHTYATSLVRRGGGIHVVQRLMGHSNIATTSRYLHLVDADLLAAFDRAFPEG